jgi:gluconolactonase
MQSKITPSFRSFSRRCAFFGALAAGVAVAGCNTANTANPEQPASGPLAAPEPEAAVKADVGAPAPAPAAPATPRALPAFCQGASAAAPIAAGARPELVKDGFVFVEGPVWSEQLGAFLFSEMDFNSQGPKGPPSKVHQLVLPKTLSVFLPEAGSNGLAIDEQGLVACTHDTQTLSRFDLKTKQRSVFVGDIQGKHFNSPNDVALHSAGHAYFTDPNWQLAGRNSDTGITGVYWRNPKGEVRLVASDLNQPNGISLSPDETRLYVAAMDKGISVYPVLADGSLGARQPFAEVAEPDGMAVDCAGNLYATSHGPGKLTIIAPDGKVLNVIDVAPKTTNAAFGGADRRTLLITAGTGVYALKSAVPGFPY